MSAVGNVVIGIKAVDEASSAMDKVRASLGIFGDTISKLGGGFDSLGGVIKGFAAGGVMGGLAATVGEVSKGLQDCFKSAKDSEDVWNKLSGTVEKSGAVWGEVKNKVESFAASMEKMSKFSDEEVAAALKTMMDYGMNLETAMKTMTTTMDLAAAKQMGLEEAATAVGKAFSGQEGALSRLGIVLPKVAKDAKDAGDSFTGIQKGLDELNLKISEGAEGLGDRFAVAIAKAVHPTEDLGKALKDLGFKFKEYSDGSISVSNAMGTVQNAFEKGKIPAEAMAKALGEMGISIADTAPKAGQFATAMDQISQKFGGAAQKDIESYAGKQAQVANAMDNLKEKIGGALLPVMNTFQDMMGNVVKGADKLVTGLGEAWKTFTEMPEIKTIAESLSGAFADLQKGFGTVADELGKVLMPLFKELWSALGDVWKALSPVIEAFGEVWKAITGLGKDSKETYTIFNLLADVLKVTIVPALTALVKGIELVTPVIKLLAEGFKAAVEIAIPAIRTIIDAVSGFVTTIKNLLTGFYVWLVGGSFIQDTMAAAALAFKEGFDAILKGFGDWVAGITKAFTDWGNGLLDFFTKLWDSMVNVVGSAFNKILDTVKNAINAVTALFSDLWKRLVGGSIWTDMWKEMLSQTTVGFDQILSETTKGVGRFQGMFGSTAIGLAGPAAPSLASPAAVGAPSRTNVTVYSSVGTLYVGNKSDLDAYLRRLYGTVVDAVRAT